MARFNVNEADNYGSSSTGSFFTLKNDKDTARVRFLYDGIEDIEGYAVHEVEIGDSRRYVNCLRNYNEPVDKCPFCAARMKIIPKLFLKMYNVDTGEVQIWERGKSYFQKMSSLSARYTPLYNEVVEIERNGKKGDQKTTYEFFPIENSEFDISSVEVSEPLGTIILDKTADDMEAYLNTGEFPDSAPVRRAAPTETRQEYERPVIRRTPSRAPF